MGLGGWESRVKAEAGGGEREREKQASRRAGTLMQGSVPGPWDHELGQGRGLTD